MSLAFLAVFPAVSAFGTIKLRWEFPDKISGLRGTGYAVALDANGDIYVAGSQIQDETGLDRYRACLEKISSFHQFVEWTKTINGSGTSIYQDSYKAVVAVPGGQGAVVGGTNWSLAKHAPQAMLGYYKSAAGTTGWFAQPDADSVEGVALRTDPVSGSIFVYAVGIKQGVAGNNTDIWYAKYDFYGKELDSQVYTDPANVDDAALAVAVNPAGFVYIAGYRTPYLAGAPGRNTKNIWLGKFDENLNPVWEYELDGPASSTDFAASIALGSAGEVYLSGAVSQSGTFFQENRDLWVARINDTGAAGVLAWSHTRDGGELDNDTAWGVAVDSSGNVWSTGSVDTPGSHWADLWLGKFSPAGLYLDSYQRDYSGNGDDIGRGVAISSVGPVVTGVETDIVTRETLYTAQFLEWFSSPSVTPEFVNAYPNPFRPGSSGSFGGAAIVVRSLPPGCTVRFYTISGNLVREIKDDDADGKVSWDARNAAGKDAESGVYIFAAQASGSGIKKGKVVIIR